MLTSRDFIVARDRALRYNRRVRRSAPPGERGSDLAQRVDRANAKRRERASAGPARAGDYLFLLRPMILIPVWTFYLLGAHHGSRAASTGLAARRHRIVHGAPRRDLHRQSDR
jgi:hypothetical protein